jgi:molybdate transport system ATP-binding protein
MENSLIRIDIQKALLSSEGTMTLDVTTDIHAGTLSVLFGPSGAGKTTLLRILAGLTKPDAGRIQFGDTVWFDSARKIDIPPQQRRIGLMFQDYALFPNMTVEQNIQFAQDEIDRSFTQRLLEIFELMEFAERKPMLLSGGQKQRVALARAIARKPQLLLLDEPLSALDTAMRVMLQDEITKAHTMFGMTTIMVSHDLNEVFRLAHHVVCIEHGTVTAIGEPQNVFTDTSVSGKFQVTGQIAAIEKQDVLNIVTVITGNNSIVNVIAFDDDIAYLAPGDRVLVFSKAFNPIIKKIS